MNRISLIKQAGALKSYFPSSTIKTRDGEKELIWEGKVTPSPLSFTYTLKIHYKFKEVIKVYVVNPQPLAFASGKLVLPHVYSTPEQRLCLYYPKDKEWNLGMYYVHSLIPWACEWLIHYELWVSTGIWHGGGIHHENEAEMQEKLEENIVNKNEF